MKERKTDMNGLERELSRHLGPVKAPDELWDRMQGGSHGERVRFQRQRGWGSAWALAIASAATIAVVAGILWLNREIPGEERAVLALSRLPEQLQFRSADAAQVRGWVKAGAGLDIPMPVRTASSVELFGANVSRNGTPTAEISYRVGGVSATLVVSKIPLEGDGKHAFVKSGSYHGANFQSWTMRGQMYTIASADARVGCMLCHSTGAPRALVN